MVDTKEMIVVPGAEGNVEVYVPLSEALKNDLEKKGVVTPTNGKQQELEAASTWSEGTLYYPNTYDAGDHYRSPKLTVPQDYYTRVAWSQEYYQQEPLVYSLVNRDIDQAITDEDFQLPEDQENIKGVLQEWRSTLNSDIGQHGGLSEYNRSLCLDLMLSSLSLTLANWGPVLYKGKVFQMPRVLVNLNPLSVVPDIDTFTGQRKYYYKLSEAQYNAIKNRRKNAISEIIPDARSRLITDIEFISNKLRSLSTNYHPLYLNSHGFFLELPVEDMYVINFRARQQDRWPMPSLVPIFSAVAIKRKLQLADWSVADGMINMVMVFKFPAPTNPKEAKKFVQKVLAGGRVQSLAVPAGVEVELITPKSDILNSSEKFWQPVSEILAHFGYPLNSKSRGAGDLDSGPLDLSVNRARLEIWREAIEDHNNFWLRKIKERNGWDFDVYALMQRDLDDDANFRTFVLSAFDRGMLSIETLHEKLKTSTERERARREREAKDGTEDVFQVRTSFVQGVGPQQGPGRPADGEDRGGAGPRAITSTGRGDISRGQGRSSRNRPKTSGQGGKQG